MSVYGGLEKQHRSRNRRKTQPLQAGFRLSGSFEMSMGKKGVGWGVGNPLYFGMALSDNNPQTMHVHVQAHSKLLSAFLFWTNLSNNKHKYQPSPSLYLQRPTTAPPAALPHTRKAHFLSSICFFLTQIQSLSLSLFLFLCSHPVASVIDKVEMPNSCSCLLSLCCSVCCLAATGCD